MEMEQKLPIGQEAAIVREPLHYNVSGLFLYADLIYKALDFVEKKYAYRIPIRYLYGSPRLLWNGGRTLIHPDKEKGDFLERVSNEILEAKRRRIIPLFTFSNISLTDEDLKDEKGNQVLKLIENMGGEIIVASDLLEGYIRKNFPNIPLHASVIKTVERKERTIESYTHLSKRYKNYVIHVDDNFNENLLEKLPKENAEIMLNERCEYRCQNRRDHYESISCEQKECIQGKHKKTNFMSRCRYIPIQKQCETTERNVSLSVSEMKKIVGLGYRQFKLQGRTDDLYSFFFDFFRYTMENEIVFPTSYTIFCSIIQRYEKKNKEK